MNKQSPLDAAHNAMLDAPEDKKILSAFYQAFVDSDILILLDKKANGDTVSPKVLTVSDNKYILGFDTEDRFAEFADDIADHMIINGRVIAEMLVGKGIGFGLNIGVDAHPFLMPPEALEWINSTLAQAPEKLEGQPTAIDAPQALPPVLLAALEGKLARAGRLAECAYLAAFAYEEKTKNTLVFINVVDQAQPALAQAVNEAVVFVGQVGCDLDVVFLDSHSPILSALEKAGVRIDLPKPENPEPFAPQAPGKDPNNPPILK